MVTMNNYQSDKIGNPIIERYKELFNSDKSLNILEVGVGYGGFLNWLGDHFKCATICGIDIRLERVGELKEGIEVLRCDQNDSVELSAIGDTYGPFDLIIDDGCHFAKETKNTFDTLWKYIGEGGWYSIEDWGMGYSDNKVFHGMVDLVLSIAKRRNGLDIQRMKMIIDDGYSIALFKKLKL